MSQIRIRSTLISMGETIKNEVDGIITDKKLIYDENNSKMLITLGEDEIKLRKSDDEHILDLPFKKEASTTGIYTLLGINSSINIDIYTKVLQIENNYIKINYNFNGEERTYELEYEVIE